MYGLPYQGSKNFIAESIVALLPPADTFIDIFAGGCAITHCALLSNKFKHVIANDITDTPHTFRDAANGAFLNQNHWVGREQFNQTKATDPYARLCFSFGNNGQNYFCRPEAEPVKQALWQLCKSSDEDERAAARSRLGELELTMKPELFARYSRRLQPMSALNRINSIYNSGIRHRIASGIVSLDILKHDYRQLNIPAGAVIYADPPYQAEPATSRNYYRVRFDHEAFFNWCRDKARAGHRVYISEYRAPDDFRCVAQIRHTSRFARYTTTPITEKLFTPDN